MAVACGGGDGDEAVTEDASPAETTTSSFVVVTPLEVEVTRDVRYHEDIGDLHPPLLDVYAPTEADSWPVVMMFHGGAGLFQDKSDLADTAQIVAAEGDVVFVPSIGGPDDDAESPSPEIMTGMISEVACASSFPVEQAEEYGADPNDLNLYGFSGGAQASGPMMWNGATVGERCLAESPAPTPITAVFFEGDWLLAPSWDDGLDTGAFTYEDVAIWDDLDDTPEVDIVVVLGTDSPESLNHRIPFGDVWSDVECGSDAEGWVPRGEPPDTSCFATPTVTCAAT